MALSGQKTVTTAGASEALGTIRSMDRSPSRPWIPIPAKSISAMPAPATSLALLV